MTDEQRGLAGEYVLGTLSAPEKAEAERLLRTDAAFAAEVRYWEGRLAALSAATPPVAPPPLVWDRIEAGLGAPVASSARAAPGMVVELRRKVGIWRTATIAVGALAAALAFTLFLGPTLQSPTGERYVAVLDSDTEAGPPAFIVDVDTATGVVAAYSVAVAAPPDRSLELWYIGDGQPAFSLGTLDAVGARIEVAMADIAAFDPNDALFAITDEPRGGSPTGVATGTILYTGELIRTVN